MLRRAAKLFDVSAACGECFRAPNETFFAIFYAILTLL